MPAPRRKNSSSSGDGPTFSAIPAGDGSPAREAQLTGPKGIAIRDDELFIVDTEAHAVRVVDLVSGVISLVADGMARPHGIWADSGVARSSPSESGALFVGDSEHHHVLRLDRV